MVKIEPFEVEQWMDRYETTPGVLNIAETCAASVSVQELITFSEHKDDDADDHPLDLTKKLTYGAIRGSDRLRERIAAQYNKSAGSPDLGVDDIIVTQGAIAANFLLLYTLVGPDDHVVCVHPTYQQLYSVPESLGAEVSLWKLKAENRYVPDVKELEGLVQENTKMIILNNPNNPTGALIPKEVLESVTSFAKARDIIVLCDEVYSPLFHGVPQDEHPPSILSFGYDKTISTRSMSKAYALAGIRIGWIATRNRSIFEAVASARDYTTISVSQIDDQIATYALSDAVLPALMRRNVALAQKNAALLAAFVEENHAVCSWVKPVAGTTAFVQFVTNRDELPVEDEQFCIDVLNETKVMFLPGSRCFGPEDFKGFVRIGYVCETHVLEKGLQALGEYVKLHLSCRK